ncbi:hypothetical protein CORC01_04765 [Colletotrichum orchidophilum]|uniref:Uncharacterized protein n=1 Tax=Colletotrichum orchidophilum TaxID=1209926 RepID=A0A1G4BEJ7_9PEZI|nr:uncharacterized protein CORC01_04765 [Colletotrichum orchidophilum]OHE99864.1 hypothetical protein CORC01_04765 [Colletotrichum orchidophilum]
MLVKSLGLILLASASVARMHSYCACQFGTDQELDFETTRKVAEDFCNNDLVWGESALIYYFGLFSRLSGSMLIVSRTPYLSASLRSYLGCDRQMQVAWLIRKSDQKSLRTFKDTDAVGSCNPHREKASMVISFTASARSSTQMLTAPVIRATAGHGWVCQAET